MNKRLFLIGAASIAAVLTMAAGAGPGAGRAQAAALPTAAVAQAEDKGVLIVRVAANSPAAKAGLKRGDILLTFGGKDINAIDDLSAALKDRKPKDEVKVVVLRGDNQREFTLVLGDQNGKPYIGITPFAEALPGGSPAVPEQAMPAMTGALIAEVAAGSPADKAGLKQGDTVVSVDGASVDASNTLSDLIGSHRPGDTVKLGVIRAGARSAAAETVEVVLGENPDTQGKAYLGVRYSVPRMLQVNPDEESPANPNPAPGTPSQPTWPKGLMQMDIVVGQVVTDSPAARAGVKVGDIIIKVDGDAVQMPQEVVSAVQAHQPGDKLTLVVSRDGADKALTATLGENPTAKGKAWLGIGMSARMQQPAVQPDGKQGALPWGNMQDWLKNLLPDLPDQIQPPANGQSL